jgi:hypothetical protein
MTRRLLLLLACLATLPLQAADDPGEILAADDARIAAMLKPERAALDAAFADELHYAHSNGIIDTKARFLDSLLSGRTRYLAYEPGERSIRFPAPGIALMSGRTKLQVEIANGRMEATLGYLAVWRKEDGRWRFLAWQSARMPTE